MTFSTVAAILVLINSISILLPSVGCLNDDLITLRISPSSNAYHIDVSCYLSIAVGFSSVEFLGDFLKRQNEKEVRIPNRAKHLCIDVRKDGTNDSGIKYWFNTVRFEQATTVELSMDYSKNSAVINVSVPNNKGFYCLRQLEESEEIDDAGHRSLFDQRSPPSSPSSRSLLMFGSAGFLVSSEQLVQVRLNNLDQLNSCSNGKIFADLLYYKSIHPMWKEFSVAEFEEAIANKILNIP